MQPNLVTLNTLHTTILVRANGGKDIILYFCLLFATTLPIFLSIPARQAPTYTRTLLVALLMHLVVNLRCTVTSKFIGHGANKVPRLFSIQEIRDLGALFCYYNCNFSH